jgi:hypothetical protein
VVLSRRACLRPAASEEDGQAMNWTKILKSHD